MSLAMVPLIILFELSILLARWLERIKPPAEGPAAGTTTTRTTTTTMTTTTTSPTTTMSDPREDDERFDNDDADEDDAARRPRRRRARRGPDGVPRTIRLSWKNPTGRTDSPMLFDLRGRGRRRTVQVIYLGLAILMGGGLVLFGIGSSSVRRPLRRVLDDNASGGSATEAVDKRIKAQPAKVRANPKTPSPRRSWRSCASSAPASTARAGRQLHRGRASAASRLAADAWERHLALDPKQPNLRAANLMVQAYQGLDEPAEGRARQTARDGGREATELNLYQQLAAIAYQAGDNRLGDLAATRAVDLARPTNARSCAPRWRPSSPRSPPSPPSRRHHDDAGASGVGRHPAEAR